MATLVDSECERCGQGVRVEPAFLEAVQRGEAQNRCNDCYARDERERRSALARRYKQSRAPKRILSTQRQ